MDPQRQPRFPANARERFNQIAHFERLDDPFFFGVPAWNRTIERWTREGLPVAPNSREINAYLLGFQDEREGIIPNAAVLGMGENGNPPWAPPLVPFFETRVLYEDADHVVKIDYDGATVRALKEDPESMVQWLEYPVKDWRTWEAYKKRLDPTSPERFPPGWDTITADKLGWPARPEIIGKHLSQRDFAIGMNCLTLFGGPRNYMGLEGLSFALYDDPLLVEDMLEWQTYFACEMLKMVFATGLKLDFAWIWEDMAGKSGPLVSPAFVRRSMAPRYRRVVDLLRSNGVDLIILDSDGDIRRLIPIWLECGINGFYPFEIASGMDPLDLRKQYGRNFVITGGVDKRLLAQGRTELDQAVEKVQELLRYGGYFPSCDHHIPPDVSLPNIVYFIDEVRKLSAYPETRRVIPERTPAFSDR